MIVLTTSGWTDYELLDSGGGYRLERFGSYTLARPDPQAIWDRQLDKDIWEHADATFSHDRWNLHTQIPQKWLFTYYHHGIGTGQEIRLKLWAKLTPFKHTGIFPEQSLQWEWMLAKLQNQSARQTPNEAKPEIKILNLFGYTGAASLIAASAGASVTHVDASKPSVAWAKENQAASGLSTRPIRWILDDVLKFTNRELKRGNHYDGIVMDPPVYGHGAKSEIWKFNESFPKLIKICQQLLSKNPLFLIINAYAISASSLMLENLLNDVTKDLGGTTEAGEIALAEKGSGRLLSTGIFGRWSTL